MSFCLLRGLMWSAGSSIHLVWVLGEVPVCLGYKYGI